MKAHKFIACLMVAVLLVQTTVVPAFASPVEEPEESVEFVEVYYPTDENGYINGLVPYTAQTYSVAAAAVAIGTVAVVSVGVAVLVAMLVGVGLDLTEDTVNLAISMYNKFSDYAKAELESKNLGTMFTPSSALVNEVNDYIQSNWMEDDGSFIPEVLTFNPTSFLQYNYEAQYTTGNVLAADCYLYPYDSDEVLAIDGTTLTIQRLDGTTGTPDLLITNTATGVTLLYTPTAGMMDTSGYNEYFSPFTVQTLVTDSGFVYHNIGIWYLTECIACSNGEACLKGHLNPYNSCFFNMFSSTEAGIYHGMAALNGTGTILDGDLIKGLVIGADHIKYFTQNNGTQIVSVTPFEYVCSVPSAITVTQNPSLLDEDKPIYVPDAPAYQEMSFAQPDVLEPPADPEPLPDIELDKGFIGNLIALIKQIFMGFVTLLSGFFADAADAIGALFDNFISGAKEFFDQMGTGHLAFFEFMRNLWACFPVVIRGLLGIVLSIVIFFGLLKMFF